MGPYRGDIRFNSTGEVGSASSREDVPRKRGGANGQKTQERELGELELEPTGGFYLARVPERAVGKEVGEDSQ